MEERVKAMPTMQSENAPFLVGQDITADLLFFALDRLYVCKHAVGLKPLCQFGCGTPIIRTSELRENEGDPPKLTAVLCKPASETSCSTKPSCARSHMKRFRSASVRGIEF